MARFAPTEDDPYAAHLDTDLLPLYTAAPTTPNLKHEIKLLRAILAALQSDPVENYSRILQTVNLLHRLIRSQAGYAERDDFAERWEQAESAMESYYEERIAIARSEGAAGVHGEGFQREDSPSGESPQLSPSEPDPPYQYIPYPDPWYVTEAKAANSIYHPPPQPDPPSQPHSPTARETLDAATPTPPHWHDMPDYEAQLRAPPGGMLQDPDLDRDPW